MTQVWTGNIINEIKNGRVTKREVETEKGIEGIYKRKTGDIVYYRVTEENTQVLILRIHNSRKPQANPSTGTVEIQDVMTGVQVWVGELPSDYTTIQKIDDEINTIIRNPLYTTNVSSDRQLNNIYREWINTE